MTTSLYNAFWRSKAHICSVEGKNIQNTLVLGIYRGDVSSTPIFPLDPRLGTKSC